MNIDLQKSLDDLKAQWMVGGAAWDKSPRAWREAIQEDPFPELAILALAGQAIQFALQPNSDGNLQLLPLLPRLRLAPPPPSARQQFCLLVRIAMLTESQMSGVIHLFAARGFAVHPLDFMPRHFQQLPECYSPWQAWQQSDAAIDSMGENDEINSENWDAWLPADRRTALAQLRQQHPSSCRDLIAEKAIHLPADERLRVVELLADGLTADDRIVLESFEKDRSAKVRQFVQLCLARIGISQEDESDRNEFAAFYTVTKKMLSRGLKVTANPLKTDAQKKRRAELASKLSLQGLMRGLSLASEEELIDGWHHVEAAASNELVKMVAATGSDRAVTALARRLASLEGIAQEPFQLLFQRMGDEGRRELLPRVLQNDDASFSATLTCCQNMLGEIPWGQIQSLPALKELVKLCKGDSTSSPGRQERVRQGIFSLGLIVDQAAASELLKLFSANDNFVSDPILGILKLNVCLPAGEFV